MISFCIADAACSVVRAKKSEGSKQGRAVRGVGLDAHGDLSLLGLGAGFRLSDIHSFNL